MSLNIKTDETCRLHETAVTAAPNCRMSVANVLEVSIVVEGRGGGGLPCLGIEIKCTSIPLVDTFRACKYAIINLTRHSSIPIYSGQEGKMTTFYDFQQQFPDDEACLHHIMVKRYGGTEIDCPKCGAHGEVLPPDT